MSYRVVLEDTVLFETESRREAIRKANRAHLRSREPVTVVDGQGKTVFYKPARKQINQIPKYTRVVNLPAGLEVPKGMRVAYVRPRYNGAILHDPDSGNYAVMELTTGRLLKQRFKTTSEAGNRVVSGVGPAGKRYAHSH